MKNSLKKTVSIAVLTLFIAQTTTASYASWGAQRILQLQNQSTTPVASQPSNDQSQENQSNSGSTQPNNNSTQVENNSTPSETQSTRDLILSLRRNQSVSENTNTQNSNQNNTNDGQNNTENSNQSNTNDSQNNTQDRNNNTSQPTPSAPSNNHGSISVEESSMIDMVNQERVENGLQPLEVHIELVDVARMKSKDMVENNYFAHTSPTLGTFTQMVSNAGISYRQIGENLANAGSVQRAHMLLMGSQGHRENILNPSFTHIGIGITQGTQGIMVTQLFMQQ